MSLNKPNSIELNGRILFREMALEPLPGNHTFLFKPNIPVTVTTKRPIVKKEDTQQVHTRKHSLKSTVDFLTVQYLSIIQVQLYEWCSILSPAS